MTLDSDESERERYRAAVFTLPDTSRVVFLLHRRDGLEYTQIAARLDMSTTQVGRHLAEALNEIMRALDGNRGAEM